MYYKNDGDKGHERFLETLEFCQYLLRVVISVQANPERYQKNISMDVSNSQEEMISWSNNAIDQQRYDQQKASLPRTVPQLLVESEPKIVMDIDLRLRIYIFYVNLMQWCKLYRITITISNCP